eukprot:10677479-Alexandrium_andersonii.AAC.1
MVTLRLCLPGSVEPRARLQIGLLAAPPCRRQRTTHPGIPPKSAVFVALTPPKPSDGLWGGVDGGEQGGRGGPRGKTGPRHERTVGQEGCADSDAL